MKTLVVDDNEAFRSGFVEYLKTDNNISIVGEASNGFEAVALCSVLEPDLVLMDVSMPIMDGVEATKEIRKQGAKAKVVLVTIHEPETYSVLAEDLHVDGFVSKKSIRQDLPRVLQKIQTQVDNPSASR